MKALKILALILCVAFTSVSCGEDDELTLACEYALSAYNNASQAYANQPSQGSCEALQSFFFNLLQECSLKDIKEQLDVTQVELDSISTAIQTINC